MILPAAEIQKIGVFRALQLGDMLCHIPAMRALRNAYPSAEIVLIGLPWCKEFTARFSHIYDRFIQFPGYPGLPEQPYNEASYHGFLQQIRAESFDLLLQMQGNGTIVNEMMSNWNPKYLAGFSLDPVSPFFLKYPEGIHEIERHLALMLHLDVPSKGVEMEFPITVEDNTSLQQTGFPFPRKSYVCIHPGSRGAYRQWPPENFALAANLCAEYGLRLVLTGTEAERPIIEKVVDHLDHPYFDACGLTGIGGMAQLVKDAALIVCNCTGVSHIAAAVKTPGVIISMDGEPERWGPLDKHIHKVINWLETPDLGLVLLQLVKLIKSRESVGAIRTDLPEFH